MTVTPETTPYLLLLVILGGAALGMFALVLTEPGRNERDVLRAKRTLIRGGTLKVELHGRPPTGTRGYVWVMNGWVVYQCTEGWAAGVTELICPLTATDYLTAWLEKATRIKGVMHHQRGSTERHLSISHEEVHP